MRLIFLWIIFISIPVLSQIRFEKGYFVDNRNFKVECLIKNFDWKDNPDKIFFKKTESDSQEAIGIKGLKEFGIYGKSKYKKYLVKIDRSPRNINELSSNRDPIWSEEEIFLQVIIEGNISLFYHEEGNHKSFFYSLSDSSVQQLIHKEYNENYVLKQNNDFRQQLYSYIRCEDTKIRDVENLNYTIKDLTRYFANYYECIGDSSNQPSKNSRKGIFVLKLASGMDQTTLDIKNDLFTSRDFTFKNHMSFRFSFQPEFILPFNNFKWSLYLEPTFVILKKEVSSVGATVDFKAIEFPVGIRHYFYINNHTRLFLNFNFNPSFTFTSKPQIVYSNNSVLDINPGTGYGIGVGVEYKKASIEYRYISKRDFLLGYAYWSSNYQVSSIIVGYKISKKK
jgi:hypothetical protein